MMATDGSQYTILSIPHYSEKRLNELLAAMIIMDELLLLTIEGQWFHNLCNVLIPNFSFIHGIQS